MHKIGDVSLDQTLTDALQNAADSFGDRTFLRIDGHDTTFAGARDEVSRLAAELADRGIGPGTQLSVFMRNSKACVLTWLATNWLGAAWVPINTEWRGPGLANAVHLAKPSMIILDEDLFGPLSEALGSQTEEFQIIRAPQANLAAGLTSDLSTLIGTSTIDAFEETTFADTAGMLYTSGTTGRSKACVLSHRYFVSQASLAIRDFGIKPSDVLYCPFPLFHADATALTVVPALLTGATAAIGRRFSASGFWPEVRSTGATVFDFMGATLSMLNKAAPTADDADNPVRLAWGVPVPDWAPDFEARFGLQVVELYGSVEANIPITQHHDSTRIVGSCGKPTPEFEIRIADTEGDPVQPNETGELLVRPRISSTVLDGYFGDPAATASAFEGLWFHSGDLAKMDAEENVYFVGRLTESIRRRGENISGFEVEEGIVSHPDVLECAAIGVPSDLTEEEIKVFIVARPDAGLDAATLWKFSETTMARFQVPRYIEFVDSLPKTPTGKISKANLSKSVSGSACWDREYVEG